MHVHKNPILSQTNPVHACHSKESIQVKDILYHISCYDEQFAHHPTPKVENPFVGCPLLLIQCIHSHPQYMEAITSIHKLKMNHVMVTDPLVKEWFMTIIQKKHFYYVYASCTRIMNVLYLLTADHLEYNCMFYIFLLKKVLECK
jgi:hypothetical protein